MGYGFNSGGIFAGWSTLFDRSSIETLKESLKLPMPKRKTFIESSNGVDITSFLEEFDQIESAISDDKIIDKRPYLVARIAAYNKLLRFLYQQPTTEIKCTKFKNRFDVVLSRINSHEQTKFPVKDREMILKNFISYGIQDIVEDPRNIVAAYSYITMKDMEEVAATTPKGLTTNSLSLFNPAFIPIMQAQNMIGKDVISITATAMKASFMWNYYLNDQIRKANSLDNMNKYTYFNLQTTRIKGRNSGTPQKVTITGLPGMNLLGVNSEIAQQFSNRLTPNITTDLMNSQFMSAATDNAKALILDKINAGTKLAKVYLFLITCGYDIKDIVKFMTSPAIEFVDKISNSNIYTGYFCSVDNAIRIALGDYSSIFKKYYKQKGAETLKQWLQAAKITENELTTNNGLEKLLAYLEQNSMIDSDIYIELEEILNLKKSYGFNEDSIKDLQELQNVIKGANEFSMFGQLLGLNQGLPTSKEDLTKLEDKFNRLIRDTIPNDVLNNNPELKNFDLLGFLQNKTIQIDGKYVSYKQYVKDLFDEYKQCINIFDVLEQIPQYKSILKLLQFELVIDREVSLKSKIYNYITEKLTAQGYTNLSDTFKKNMLNAITNEFIKKFLTANSYLIPYSEGATFIDEYNRNTTMNSSGLLDLGKTTDLYKFKSYVEEYLVPKLKQGIYTYWDGNNFSEVINTELVSNQFIKSLVNSRNDQTEFIKCNINMSDIDLNAENNTAYQAILNGLLKLQSIKVTDKLTLADIFILYNLIVNKNMYGQDRMTRLFADVLGNKTILDEYYSQIGQLDFSRDITKIDFNIRSILRNSASIIREGAYIRDPYVLVNKSDGYHLLTSLGTNSKVPSREEAIIPKLDGEVEDEYIERVNNYRKHDVLGLSYQLGIIDKVNKLNSNDPKVLLNILTQLIKNNTISPIIRICK